ncbi:MAG: choice-of-anchor I family protein [Bacteroidota bacterium]|nr:choice-of-anchor I family protein [Bacteroidota bacterium]MDX5428338.1 choice-of-anchor I family protein [Bacteroidota bacterium]MDX5447754.1 choice-of-anchor I family protein [Bacteroidota bacterium]MDX5506112.1 choice-of-anchor I family protein [Bacteroidota bacterium]
MRRLLLLLVLAGSSISAQNISMQLMGTYATGIFDDAGTEIITYDPTTQRIFSTNGSTKKVDVINISNPSSPTLVTSWTIGGGGINSIACKNGIIAVAVENLVKQDSGRVVFLDANGTKLDSVTVGALPDMVTFSPNGLMVLTANEGEPSDDYLVDPNGSVSIIELANAGLPLSISSVTHLDFSSVTSAQLDSTVRINGNNGAATIAQDLEPEYVAISEDNSVAWVSLQENNALAEIDLTSRTLIAIHGMGYKDHSLFSNALDASDRRNIVEITNHDHLFGLYMPDAIATFTVNNSHYLITANEGDGRDYSAFSDEERVKDLTLDGTAFPNASLVQQDTVLGRLTVSTSEGDVDNDGDYDYLCTFGGRSFSIWDIDQATLIYDSGNELEQQVLASEPQYFNSNNDDNNSFKNRSDNKGPEPEAVEIAVINGRTFAFIGLERQSGVMIFDVSNPSAPIFEDFVNNRDFSQSATTAAAGDLGPEDVLYIPATSSPNGKHLVAVSNEVSGSVSIYELIGQYVGLEEAEYQMEIRVFPNPSVGLFHLDRPADIEVVDITGKVILTKENVQSFDLSGVSKGIYFVRVNDQPIQKLILD